MSVLQGHFYINFVDICFNFEFLREGGGARGGVVVKLLACGASQVRGWIPGLAARISVIGYLLLPSRNMAEISLKLRKSSKQPTTK